MVYKEVLHTPAIGAHIDGQVHASMSLSSSHSKVRKEYHAWLTASTRWRPFMTISQSCVIRIIAEGNWSTTSRITRSSALSTTRSQQWVVSTHVMADGILVITLWPTSILPSSSSLSSLAKVRHCLRKMAHHRLQQFPNHGLPDGSEVYLQCSSHPGCRENA